MKIIIYLVKMYIGNIKLLLKDFKVFALEFRAKLTLSYAQSAWGFREERVQDVELVAYFNNFWGKKKSLADKCIYGFDTSIIIS